MFTTDYPLDEDGRPMAVRLLPVGWVPTQIDTYPYLGYSENNSWRHDGNGNTLVPSSHPNIVEVHRAVAWVVYYDEAIQKATEDTVVSQLDKMSVDFVRQIAVMKLRAAEWVDYLGMLINVPVRYNRFRAKVGTICITRPV